jgi:hypothetical protein
MKKTVAAALAAIALIGALAVSTQDAEARRWGRGFGIGLGIGLLGVGAGSYAYGTPYYVRECEWVERYDRYGRYRGLRKVCAVVPY